MKKKELSMAKRVDKRSISKVNNSIEASGSGTRKKFEALESRMAPTGLFQFINSGLSEKQISDISEIGFGGLLKIKTDKIHGHLASWLLSSFDPFTSSIIDKKLPIRDEDIHLTTGLPIGGKRVDIASKMDKSDEFVAACTRWKSQYQGIDKVTNKHILEKMIGQREGGDDFKRNFVVYVVSMMLMGVKGIHASLRVLKCLTDVSLVSKLDWCLFTRQNLIESVIQWRKEKEIEENGGPKKSYKGPILILLYIYLDRVVFKVRTVPREFPTLSTWTKEEISRRISMEKKEAGTFGVGFIDDTIVKRTGSEKVEKESMADLNYEGLRDGEKRTTLKACIDNLATSGIGLAEAFDKFNKAVNEAKEEMPNSEAVGQMSSLAESMLEGFNLTPPKKQDGGSQEKEKHFEVGESSKVVNGDTSTTPCTTTGLDDFEDPCWYDEVFLESVEALCKAFCREPVVVEPKNGVAVADDEGAACEEGDDVEDGIAEPNIAEHVSEAVNGVSESGNNVSEDQVDVCEDQDADYECTADDVAVCEGEQVVADGEDEDDVAADEQVVADGEDEDDVAEDEQVVAEHEHEHDVDSTVEPKSKRRRLNKDPSMPSFNLLSSEEQSEENVECDNEGSPIQQRQNDKAMIGYSTPPMRRKSRRLCGSPPISPLDITPLSTLHVAEDQRRKPSKRNVTVTNLFKSPFLQRNVDIFSDLSQVEKDVADFAFYEGFDESEILFSNEVCKLSRYDMKSLISNKRISTDVIICWSHILNKKEEYKAASSPLRLYAEVTSNSVRCTHSANYENVSLMFFPFNYDEAILVCVNFLTSKIEVIHPMKPKSVAYMDLVNIVRQFIEMEMVQKAKKFGCVGRFKVEEYVPRNRAIDGSDCGIHLMRNMETYAGSRRNFNNGLSSNLRPNVILENKLKVKYCHAILMFHQNQMLNQVHLRVKDMRMSIRTRLAGKSVAYSDDHLLKYAFKAGKSELARFDVLVDTKWGQVTRMGMCTLKPRQWIMDMVIDMYGIYSTISKPHCLYIPTRSKFVKPEKDTCIGGQYMKMTYMPNDGSVIKKVFIPLSLKEHWFLCVADFQTSRIYVLDSLPDNCSVMATYEFVDGVMKNVCQILARKESYEHFLQIVDFAHIHVLVPEQKNGYDCGVHVLKWLEVAENENLWEGDGLYKDFDEYRKIVALRLLRWEENMRKNF